MPAYDPVKYPKSLVADPSPGQSTDVDPARWPDNPAIPDDYQGPPASREYETATAPTLRAVPVPAVPPPTEHAGAAPIDAPPGSPPHPL
jgi:hypothetical protein